jgi:hypothetical protein
MAPVSGRDSGGERQRDPELLESIQSVNIKSNSKVSFHEYWIGGSLERHDSPSLR